MEQHPTKPGPDPAEPDLRTLVEEAEAGYAAPLMDLMAAGVLVAIALWFAIESLRLPVPGDLFTAPGLLPFLVAASLLIMALMLGANALMRQRTARAAGTRIGGLELPPDFWRTMGLGAALTVYVAALQVLPVATEFTLGGLRIVIGSFEVSSVIALTAILRAFWQAPLAHCLGVTVGWIAFLSTVFRMIFQVQLP